MRKLSGPILVTGASGLLGANLALTLSDKNLSTVAVTHRNGLKAGFPCVQADLTQRTAARSLILKTQPAWVIHCAAQTNVDWCESNALQAHRTNVDMTQHLAEAAAEIGAGFVLISTDSVFDGEAGDYTEADAPHPLNVYARSKRQGETVAETYCPGCLVVRTTLYGWNSLPKRSLAEWMLYQFETGQPFPGFQDVIFTPLLVNDLAELLIEMMSHGLQGIYHVGSSDALTKYTFARMLADVFRLDGSLAQPMRLADIPLPAPRPLNSSLCTDRLHLALGHPLPTVRAGLERFKTLRDSGHVARLLALRGEVNP